MSFKPSWKSSLSCFVCWAIPVLLCGATSSRRIGSCRAFARAANCARSRLLCHGPDMPTFKNDDVEIAFFDEGEGEPIVLVHGFASNKEVNWVAPGWVAALTRAGRRAIALDNRGHGESSKLYDPAEYDRAKMAEDVRALLDHLGIACADVMGYSMGARITANLALAHPKRVRSAIFGGLGIRLVSGGGLPSNVVRALEAPSIDAVTDPQGFMFRRFAEQTKSDLRALAACARAGAGPLSRDEVAS